jgi:hypothetical protein
MDDKPAIANFASREAVNVDLPSPGTRFVGPDGAILEFIEVNEHNSMWSKYEEETWSCWTMLSVGFVPGSRADQEHPVIRKCRLGKKACVDPRRLKRQE